MALKGKILIIDDNVDLLDYLKDFFNIYNYEVILAENGNQGIEKFKQYSPDIVITDMRLPDKTGNIIVKEVKEMNKEVPIIIITGYSDQNLILSAMENGAFELLKKPFKSKDLKYLINKIEMLFKKISIERSSSFLQWEKRFYRIKNDINIITSVVSYIFANIDYIAENDQFLKTGLQEVLINAIEHGNLKISYAEKQKMLVDGDYDKTLKEKANLPEYRNTYVDIKVFSSPEYLKIIVQDKGYGFDLSDIPDPEVPENFFRESGKGILLAMNAFDKVEFNETGNRVTLTKFSEFITVEQIQQDEQDSFEILDKYKHYSKLKEEYDFELNLAAEFQNTFLPKKENLAEFTGLKSEYIYIPLFQVSGDFIDISKLEEKIYGYFISDISGHGVAAALISSMLKVFFSLYGKDLLSPQLLYEVLNQEFFNYLSSGEYFTSFYGIYFEEERKFVFTNANHPPPLLLKIKTGEIIQLNTKGFFVGIFMDTVFEEKEVYLEPGDRILFYTDGIIEAKNGDMEEFGEKRITEIYKQESATSIGDVINIMRNEVFKFSQGKINDDLTLAIIEIQ